MFQGISGNGIRGAGSGEVVHFSPASISGPLESEISRLDEENATLQARLATAESNLSAFAELLGVSTNLYKVQTQERTLSQGDIAIADTAFVNSNIILTLPSDPVEDAGAITIHAIADDGYRVIIKTGGRQIRTNDETSSADIEVPFQASFVFRWISGRNLWIGGSNFSTFRYFAVDSDTILNFFYYLGNSNTQIISRPQRRIRPELLILKSIDAAYPWHFFFPGTTDGIEAFYSFSDGGSKNSTTKPIAQLTSDTIVLTSDVATNSANMMGIAVYPRSDEFEIVKYVGDNVAGRGIRHNFSAAPEASVVFSTTTVRGFVARSNEIPENLVFHADDALAPFVSNKFDGRAATGTEFFVSAENNVANETYMAFLFRNGSNVQILRSQGTGAAGNAIDFRFAPEILFFRNISTGGPTIAFVRSIYEARTGLALPPGLSFNMDANGAFANHGLLSWTLTSVEMGDGNIHTNALNHSYLVAGIR